MKQIKINYLHILILFSGIHFTVFSAKQTHKSAHHGGHSAKAHSAGPVAPAASPTPSPNQNQAGIPNQINNSPIGMANPMSNSQNYQVPTNSQQRIITDTLDQQKVARLIADIKNLQTNCEVLSHDLEKYIKDCYDVTNKQPNPKNQNKFSARGDYWGKCFTNANFNPTTDVITIDGNVISGVQPSTDLINPFTGNPVILQDVPMLQTIHSLLEDQINTILVAEVGMKSGEYNSEQIRNANLNNSRNVAQENRNKGTKVMFEFNTAPALFWKACNYVADGKLELRNFSIDHSKFISHDKQVMPSSTYSR